MSFIKYGLSVLCSVVLLSACGNKDQAENSAKGAESTASSKAKDSDQSAIHETNKWNSYIKAFNSLDGQSPYMASGRPSFFEEIAEKKAAEARAGDFTKIKSSSSAQTDVSNLTAALKVDASLPAVDAAAQELLDVLTQSLPAWKELEEYNKARRYEDDKGAKGKELLVKYLEGLKQSEVAYKKFRSAVEAESKSQKLKQLEAYKASGDLLGLHTATALSHAESIIDLIQNDPLKALKDSATIEKSNQLLVELEKELDLLSNTIDAEKAKNQRLTSSYQSVHQELVNFTGSYRSARKTPTADNFNQLVKNYNQAVINSNRIR